MASRLPSLVPDTINEWFEVMWVKILDEYQGHPEREHGSVVRVFETGGEECVHVENARRELIWYPQLSQLPDLSVLGRAGSDEAVRQKREEEKQKIRVLDPLRSEKEKAINAELFGVNAERGAVKSIRKALLAAMRTLVGRQGAQGAGAVDRRRPTRAPTPTGCTRHPIRSPKKRL